MASLYCSALPSQSILGFHFHPPSCRSYRPSISALSFRPNFLPTPSNFRLKNAVNLQSSQRLFAVFASSTNPPERDHLTKKSDGIKTGDGAAQGPPFLTILAGFLVLFLVFWIIGSIVMWLISLIVNVPPSK